MTEMTFVQQMMTITICAVATMATRMLPFLFFHPGKELPPYVKYLGTVLPSSVFALLVVYCLRNTNLTSGTYGIPELTAIIVTVVVHLWRRNMFFSMVAGTAVYMVILQTIV